MHASRSSRPARASSTRLKDLVSLEGVRDNQLIGYGLVVGLERHRRQAADFIFQPTLTNMLKRMGVTVDPTQMQVHNMAGRDGHRHLPPFAQPGTRIDVTPARSATPKVCKAGCS